MSFVLIIIGLILIIITLPSAKEKIFSKKYEERTQELIFLKRIEDKLDLVLNKLNNMEEPILADHAESMELVSHTYTSNSFSERLKKSQAMVEYKEIIEAHEKGESIINLAQRYNRGKGEIQLILNLKR
ncbi:MAG: hypothetical protein AB1420_08250 [Bacillota bacterium]